MSEAIPTPEEYGARFAGFLAAFNEGYFGPARWAEMQFRPPRPDEVDRADMLRRAATSAWEDLLIRKRRAETRSERDSPSWVPPGRSR